MYSKYLDIKPEVAKALEEGTPVVALESTIISHGVPYPKNVETAIAVEDVLRAHGVMPATIAIIGGRIKIGLTREETESMHGAGSPQAQRIMIQRQGNIEGKKALAKAIAGIK